LTACGDKGEGPPRPILVRVSKLYRTKTRRQKEKKELSRNVQSLKGKIQPHRKICSFSPGGSGGEFNEDHNGRTRPGCLPIHKGIGVFRTSLVFTGLTWQKLRGKNAHDWGCGSTGSRKDVTVVGRKNAGSQTQGMNWNMSKQRKQEKMGGYDLGIAKQGVLSRRNKALRTLHRARGRYSHNSGEWGPDRGGGTKKKKKKKTRGGVRGEESGRQRKCRGRVMLGGVKW